ncbi:MAG: TrkH family potassium uptake protein, partial [Oscillospiraceae bacterium]|jgi:trk system potassium uptake protein TrkH|nr:TrkH family potassium uptake protein [Oscillospiraceae bacterium]
LGSSLPFVISGRLDFVHALFESVSGWSTGGMTVVNPDTLPHIFLFHRAFMQYCGGLGFVIIIGIVIGGRQVMSMYNTEVHPGGAQPNLRRTSLTIFLIYMSCFALGAALYRVFGMPLFDAICHAMGSLATAGFSVHSSSIGYYDSLPIEIITMLLMLVGSTNFAVLLLLVRRKFRRVAKISEVRFLGCVLLIFIPLSVFSLIAHNDFGFARSLREATFAVISVLSTTGFTTANYALWPPFVVGLIMLLMLLGGATGSTAGGIKLTRAYILVRVTKSNIFRRVSPSHRIRAMRYGTAQGEEPIDGVLVRDTLEFVTVYAAIIFIGTLLITHFEDSSLMDALFEFTAAFGTVGLSNGLTAHASTPTLVVEMVAMLLGRLEIFIVFIGVFSAFDKVRDRITKKSM